MSQTEVEVICLTEASSLLLIAQKINMVQILLVFGIRPLYDLWRYHHHHDHHHPRISSRRKSWTKLQGRYVSRVTLMSMLLWPIVCVAVWSAEQFRLQCTLECPQRRQRRDRRRQRIPNLCRGNGEGAIADGPVQRPWNMQWRWRCRPQTPAAGSDTTVVPACQDCNINVLQLLHKKKQKCLVTITGSGNGNRKQNVLRTRVVIYYSSTRVLAAALVLLL